MNLHNLAEMAEPKPEPSWRELGKLIREMSWSERKDFFRIALCPWPNTSDNVNMWIGNGIQLGASIVLGSVIIRALQTSTVPGREIAAFWFVFISVELFIRLVTRRLAKGVVARKMQVTKDMMAEIQKMVDGYGKELVSKLKEASGREHIDMNPISMAAASFDAQEKHAQKSDPKANPLKAALEDTLHPSDLAGDDTDEPTL